MKQKRTRILIDADACPVTREALQVARAHKLPVIIVGNSTQNLGRHIRKTDPGEGADGFCVSTLEVSVGMDSADFALIEILRADDIVVTQDIGLAAIVLGKGAFALSVRGREFLPETIDLEMELRHAEKKIRRQGGRTGGPAPFTAENREHFSESLIRIIEKHHLS